MSAGFVTPLLPAAPHKKREGFGDGYCGARDAQPNHLRSAGIAHNSVRLSGWAARRHSG